MEYEFFERLLYEEESTTLDFKKQQYSFAKATEEQKSELLKDVLGFANAWRPSEAYILIGVEEVRGGRSNVIGIEKSDHLDDHALQQFVSNLTNRPVRFHYEAFGFEDKQVGIIHIEAQTRPLYLKNDYAKLKKDSVYVRRGSSTDPTKPATNDEIAQMGRTPELQSAELAIEFADIGSDGSLGTSLVWETEFCEMPKLKDIPPYETYELFQSPLYSANSIYYMEMAGYEYTRRLFRPVRLAVQNRGQVAADELRVEFSIPTEGQVLAIHSSEIPRAPKRQTNRFGLLNPSNIRPSSRQPGSLKIDKNSARIRVEVECGHLQPGRRIWSDIFYLARRKTGDIQFDGRVFAANLPQPKDFNLIVSVNVSNSALTVTDLRLLPEPEFNEG
jgi:hypothetical protein